MNKILVIDDSIENLESVKDLLEEVIPDCAVLQAKNGVEGIRLAKEEKPDTIITDIMMPKMDGKEVCRKLKKDEETRYIPIIVHTGSKTDTEHRIECLEAGADMFLPKPIDAGELTAQIKSMLRIKKAEDKLRNEKDRLDKAVHERTKKLRESEESLILVLENIPCAVIVHNLEGEVVLVNKAACTYWGYSKTELLNMTVGDIDHLSITRHDREKFWNKLQYGEQETIFSTHYRKDGSTFSAEIHLAGFMLKNEPVILGMIQDITERNKVEEELRINRERLKTANSILRHDISNEFIVIKSALDLYRASDDVSMLDEIDKRVEKSLAIIQKQREQERFLEKHSELDEYQIDDVLKDIKDQYPEIKITIQGTARVYADNAIYSVFENIIGNAIKHGKCSNLLVTLGCRDNICELRFADNGIGVGDQIKDRVFEKGFQYGENGHTGIGLYNVKRTIEAYGGDVFVEDNDPKGAVFVIRLQRVIER